MLRVENVTVRFDGSAALDDVTFGIAEEEVVTLLGQSGSGKSTLLRVIAGLQPPDSGRVLLDGRDVTDVPPHKRGVGLVFQDHALFQHRDVRGNVAFGLRMRDMPSTRIDRHVGEMLDLVGLEGFGRRSVATLSGGEQQRVALARALAPAPRVLLLDEPLGSLDKPLRDRLLGDLGDLFERIRVTALYVTHDQGEAFALGDRVALMRGGRIVQSGTPDELWAQPVDADAARFLGLSIRDGMAIRPEAVTVRPAGASAGDGVVESVARQGPTVRLRVRLDGDGTLDAALTSVDHPHAGDRVFVEIDPAGIVEL
jgi:thiamine transport system ATP-binding protein